MRNIRYVQDSDRAFWYSLDHVLSLEQFDQKVRNKMGYVLLVEGISVGLLRYNLFWDEHPFCTMLHVKNEYQRKGCGRALMDFWENDMRDSGYKLLLTST